MKRAAAWPARRLLVALAGLLVVAVAGFAALAYHPAVSPVARPNVGSFSPEVVARGATLAAIGDCAVCHTSQTGTRLAGGRPIPTPFGTVIATNITPDPETGIGAWSLAAFRRAMQDGIARDGSHLYPVLPYPHFIHAREDDIAALYAYLMTRDAVSAPAPPNELPFPLNQRVLLAGWNLLFLRPSPFHPDPAHDAEWNRGAYLVEAIGHCGACHAPRNALGAESSPSLAGGQAEGWYAPPLDASSPAPAPWTKEEVAAYLRTGFSAAHGAAAGPMTGVTEQLARIPEADVVAIATYIAAQMPQAAKDAATPPAIDTGREPVPALFAGACAACHAASAPMIQAGVPTLARSTGLRAGTPDSVIAAILNGIPAREDAPAAYMPGFAAALTDGQVAELAAYLRARYTDLKPWPDLEGAVTHARHAGGA